MSKTRSRARLALGITTAATLLLASACASGKPGTSESEDTGSTGGGEPVAQASGKADIFVIGGKADDPFWSKVKRGADDAGQGGRGRRRLRHLAGPAELRQPRSGRRQAHRHRDQQRRHRHRRPGLGARGPGRRVQGGRRAGHPALHLQRRRHGGRRQRRRDELRRQRRIRGGHGGRRVLRRAGRPRTSCASTRCRAPRTPRPAARASPTASRRAAAKSNSCRCRRRASATRPRWPRPSRRRC